MIDPQLQSFLDMPIDTGARANRVWAPMGKRPAPSQKRQPLPADDTFAPAATAAELRKRAESAYSTKITAVLDYYAGTSVPLERIADHTKLPLDQVANAMSRRGRTS